MPSPFMVSAWQREQPVRSELTVGWPLAGDGGRAWQEPQTTPVVAQAGEGALPWQ